MKPSRCVRVFFSRPKSSSGLEKEWSEEETRRLLREAFGSVDPDATLLMRVERRVESGVADQVNLARRRSQMAKLWWFVWIYLAVVVAAAGIGFSIRMAIEDRVAASQNLLINTAAPQRAVGPSQSPRGES